MLKLMCVICISLVTLPALCQPASKYQVATITEVKPHRPADKSWSDAVSYDVAITVGNTTYLVLYTDPLGMNTVQYAAGRNLLVLVGTKTISYNDILGRSQEVPIVSKKPAKDAKRSN